MAEFRTGQWIATIQSPIGYIGTIGTILSGGGGGSGGGYSTVTGTVTIASILAPSNVPDVGTVGTILSPVAVVGTVDIQGGTITFEGGTVVVATVLSPSTIPAVGTIGTIQFMSNVPDVGTLGTILSPVGIGGGTVTLQSATVLVGTVLFPSSVPAVGTIGTVLSPVVVGTVLGAPNFTNLGAFQIATIQNNSVVSSSGASTIAMGSLQDLVVDATYGTAIPFNVSSILPQILSVDPLSGFQTGTIVSGQWFSGTLRSGDRLTAIGPLGAFVAVAWTVALGGTLGVGTVTNVFVSAQESFSD